MNNLPKANDEHPDLTPLQKAVEISGGQSALAAKLGIRQQTVFVWLKNNKVPAERALQVEKIVNGAVTCHQLRPDIYPREMR